MCGPRCTSLSGRMWGRWRVGPTTVPGARGGVLLRAWLGLPSPLAMFFFVSGRAAGGRSRAPLQTSLLARAIAGAPQAGGRDNVHCHATAPRRDDWARWTCNPPGHAGRTKNGHVWRRRAQCICTVTGTISWFAIARLILGCNFQKTKKKKRLFHHGCPTF